MVQLKATFGMNALNESLVNNRRGRRNVKTTDEREASGGVQALLRKMNENPDGLQLAALERNGGKVRIVWQEYEGEPVLHLRFWAESEGGRLVPTKSGVTFQIFEVPAVAEALAAAARSAADCIRERRRCGPQKTKR
jgi:hypothetical protein